MIFSEKSPVSFDNSLPARCDVVVIGGGVIGISTAWFLRKAGLEVVVCEKGRVAGEQSSRNWGWVRQQGRDESELPIMMESLGIWQGLAEEIDADVGFRQHGVMYVGETEEKMEGYRNWVDLAGRHGLKSRLVGAREVDQRVRGFAGNWRGAVETPNDGRAEPFLAVPALARACTRAGVTIIENCAVRGLVEAAGRTSGVVTERGEIRCNAVVCAGGAWSSLLLRHFGHRFPQLSVKSTVVRTAPAGDLCRGSAACSDLAIRRREDGGYTLAQGDINEHVLSQDSFRYFTPFIPLVKDSWMETRLRVGSDAPGGTMPSHKWDDNAETPFERTRVLNPVPANSIVKRLRKALARRIPALADVAFVETWAGMIDTTPDVVPVIDELPTAGLFLASGFSGHGFGIGPGAGRVVADLVQGNPVGHDLTRFRFSRFSDGSKMEIGPTL